jgi:hypothetical protein
MAVGVPINLPEPLAVIEVAFVKVELARISLEPAKIR